MLASPDFAPGSQKGVVMAFPADRIAKLEAELHRAREERMAMEASVKSLALKMA
jgi:hypothetical protein